MSDRLRNMSPKNMKTLSDDVDELLRNFVSILKPNNVVKAIRFQQEVGRRGSPKSSRQEQAFSLIAMISV